MRIDDMTATDIDFGCVVNALPGIIWVTGADGRCDFVNRRWQEYTGLGSKDALEKGWQPSIHPDDLNALLDSWEFIKQSPVTQEIGARLRRADGEYRWFAFHATPLPQGAGADAHWCWLGVYADEGPALDGRLRRFFDMLPWQAGFLNTAGVSEFSNRQAFNDFKMTHEQLQQWTTSGIVHVDDHERNQIASSALLRTGEMYDEQIRMLYPGGNYRWTRARCVPVRDANGNVVRYVTFQIDVDDLKRAETLLAAEVKLLEMVARGEPQPRVLEALSHHIEELCSGSVCGILIVAPDQRHFQCGTGASLAKPHDDLLDGKVIDGEYDPCSLAVVDKSSIVCSDLVGDPRWKRSEWPTLLRAHGYNSCWSTPIISGSGEASGVIAVYRSGTMGPTSQEAELIDRFSKIAGIAIDRLRADRALKSSEAELRRTLVQLSAGQRLSKTGSFTSDITADEHRWSEEFYRIFEIDPTARPRMEIARGRVHPDDVQLFDGQIGRKFEGGDGHFTYRIVTPKDGLKYLRGVVRRVDQADGRQIIMGTVQDITDSQLAEAALRESEADFRRANMQLMDAHRLSRTGSFTWDVLADEHTWTEEIYRLFEFDPQVRVEMQMMLEAIHPEDLPAVQSRLERGVAGTEFELGFRVVPRSGEVRHARVIGRRIGASTDRPVFMGAVQDVTASKLAEEALGRARAELAHVARVATLSTMTASIAHEVSQPIAGIVTNASTLQRMLGAEPPNVSGAGETVRRMIRDANRASEVVKRLRAMFTKKALTLETVDVNDLVREVVAISSGELQRARAVLQTDFAEGLPAVSGDRVQLQQVILNLLLNAADAMAGVEDRPRVLVIRTECDERDTVKLLVRDCGMGLDPSGVNKLFDAFYTTKAHGMGVGLAISRSIIESHKGQLWAEPNQGPGATFGFTLPARQ